MAGMYLLYCLEWEYEEKLRRIRRRRKRRLARERRNLIDDLSDDEFVEKYRLTKEMFAGLCNDLRPLFKKPVKSTDLSVEQKVLTALSYYATGILQTPVGVINNSKAPQMAEDILTEVTMLMNTGGIFKKYIRFPQNLQERNQIRARFYQEHKMPGVLGCIDCTHIQIKDVDNSRGFYYSKKHFDSLNVQLICDADMQIISVDPSYGGSNGDSYIWNCQPLQHYMENLNESSWFLGDLGYAQRRILMTPIRNTQDGTPERHYNDLHKNTWNVMKNTIDLLKERFQCLTTMLPYKPELAARIINCCVILHNICNKVNIPVANTPAANAPVAIVPVANIPVANIPGTDMKVQAPVCDSVVIKHDFKDGVAVRNDLVRHLWEKREINP